MRSCLALLGTGILLTSCAKGPALRRPDNTAALRRLAPSMIMSDPSFNAEKTVIAPKHLDAKDINDYPAIRYLIKKDMLDKKDPDAAFYIIWELTPYGRRFFGDDIKSEDADAYTIRVAGRAIRNFDVLPPSQADYKDEKDKYVVAFEWYWKPVNELGRRLFLDSAVPDHPKIYGHAAFEQRNGLWSMTSVHFDDDTSLDYMLREPYYSNAQGVRSDVLD